MRRAETYEQIQPLIGLCKTGRLLDVQDWIAAGNPVNLPLPTDKKTRRKNPLEIAIESGFHSLVEVLLRAGSYQEEPRYSAMDHALEKRRVDLVELLVKYGADAKSVSLRQVFETYSPEIIEFFVAQGADFDADNPLAYALCEKIQPALGVYKRHKDRFRTFPEQVNVALRYHAKEGNLKWVSLMLWAGADQYSKGPDLPDGYPEDEEGACALELAALFGHLEIFKLKGIRPDPNHSSASDILDCACGSHKPDLLRILLDKRFDPGSLPDRGSSLIQGLLREMTNEYRPWDSYKKEKDIDSYRARDCIKMIHMLVRAGARWEPDPRAVGEARRAFLKMRADYTLEFVWIMSEYKACSRGVAESLMTKPLIKDLVSRHCRRFEEMMESLQ